MTSKVRRDFKIIPDVISRVSLVTSNIRESSICSPKSLYKKTSNEILAELKAVVKTDALKVPEAPTRHTPVCYDLSAVTSVCQTATAHTQPFQIKWEVYFSKKTVSLVFIVSSLWFCMHMYMYMYYVFV